MKLSRRTFLSLATSAAALPAASRLALAQNYPARPVHLLVGFSAGSASDIIARLIAQKLSEQLGQPFVVENRPGAGTNLAAEAVVRAPADGYTLLLATSTNAVNTTLYQHLSFNFSTDIAPVALIDLVPYVLEVTPSLPAKTLPEFIAYAKANPGKINMASNGVGSGPHVAGELFKMMAGVDLVHVPIHGQSLFRPDRRPGPGDVLADPGVDRLCQVRPVAAARRRLYDTDCSIAGRADRGRVSARLRRQRLARHRRAESTPPDIVESLNKAVNADLADAAFKAKIADLGGVPTAMTPVAFGKFIADETDKWAKVNKFADIKAE